MDFYLELIVKQILLYVKDSNDFLHELAPIKSVPDNAYLVSLDVKTLYTSIPNTEERKSVKQSFNKHNIKNVAKKVTRKFLALILILNNSVFS